MKSFGLIKKFYLLPSVYEFNILSVRWLCFTYEDTASDTAPKWLSFVGKPDMYFRTKRLEKLLIEKLINKLK